MSTCPLLAHLMRCSSRGLENNIYRGQQNSGPQVLRIPCLKDSRNMGPTLLATPCIGSIAHKRNAVAQFTQLLSI